MIIYYHGRQIQQRMLGMAVQSGRWRLDSNEILDLVSLFAVGRLVDAQGPMNHNHSFIFDFDSSALPPDSHTDLSFGQVCDNVAYYIWQQAQNRTVALWWSGGIDSTVALVALMKTNPKWAQQLKIYTTRYAIEVEYPWFYQQYLQGADYYVQQGRNLYSQELFVPDLFLLDGHCGDQLWGSRFLVDLKIDFQSPWRQLFDLEIFDNCVGTAYKDSVAAYITDQVAKFPVPIRSIADIFWWVSFTHKWDWIKRVTAARSKNPQLINRVHCFFDNWDFKRWSMSNVEIRKFQRWEQYKQLAKDYIWQYTGDQDYLDNKIKVNSGMKTLEYDSVDIHSGGINNVELVSEIDGCISDQIYLRKD